VDIQYLRKVAVLAHLVHNVPNSHEEGTACIKTRTRIPLS